MLTKMSTAERHFVNTDQRGAGVKTTIGGDFNWWAQVCG